jgi:hypothetical protein
MYGCNFYLENRNRKVPWRDSGHIAVSRCMTAFCTRCGAKLDAESRHCTQCGLSVPPDKKDRRWRWWLLALIVFFALGICLGLLLAPKCPSCPVPDADGAGRGRSGRSSGSSGPETGTPEKLKGGSDKGPAEAAGGSSTGDIEGSGKIIPHEFSGKEDTGNSIGHKSQDGDPTLDSATSGGGEDPELYGVVAKLAQGVAPGGAAVNSSQDNPGARTNSLVAYDFTYDKTNLPRYPDNVRDVASSISYALDPKTGEHTGAFGTGAGIVTTGSFDDVVDWYRKNLPAGWQSSSVGDFGQLTQQATQGPGGDLMKLLKGEIPGAASTNSASSPAAPKVRVALFKAPTAGAGSPDSTIMIMQKEDKPVSVYLQSSVK